MNIPTMVPGRFYSEELGSAPLALSKQLEMNRRARMQVTTEIELLGDGNRPETRALRGKLKAKLAKLDRRNFFLRQMALPFGVSVSDSSSEKI